MDLRLRIVYMVGSCIFLNLDLADFDDALRVKRNIKRGTECGFK